MTQPRMELECFPTTERPPEIVPGRQDRAWMDTFTARHPYRCLPLNMANCSGWEILCPMSFTAEWNGGLMQQDITLKPDFPNPDFHRLATSHFSHGVLTMHPGYLFRTPGRSWCRARPIIPRTGSRPWPGWSRPTGCRSPSP